MPFWFPALISAAVHNPDKFSVFCRISVLSGNPVIHNPYKNYREQMSGLTVHHFKIKNSFPGVMLYFIFISSYFLYYPDIFFDKIAEFYPNFP